MLEKDYPELPLKVQAELLGISYSSLFYQPVPPSAQELAIKRRIDELYTANPFYGSNGNAQFFCNLLVTPVFCH
jgi:putative transposase